MRAILALHIIREEPETSFAHLAYGDGSADVYLGDGHMLANHIAGEQLWDLLVQGARATGWVIMPVGCPACITDDSDRAHLPEGFSSEATLVLTGDDVLRVINGS